MTINQVMESLVGKTSCLTGEYADATAFVKPPDMVKELSLALENGGFSPWGTDETERSKWGRFGYESMINGQTGEMFKAKIYVGVTCYQRLKHFVSDKEHARARGPLNALMRQPVEGRAKEGGLRFGEINLRSQWHGNMLLVCGTAGNTLELRGRAVNHLVLSWLGNLSMAIVNRYGYSKKSGAMRNPPRLA